jgi:hypothetical protein
LLGKLAAPEAGATRASDVTIILSVPGIGNLVAATLLAEASQALSELDYKALRAYSGIAPVTKRSGKRLSVMMRQACSERLRNAVYHWSRISVQRDDISRKKYAALRAKGHSHGRALRTVGDSLLRRWLGVARLSCRGLCSILHRLLHSSGKVLHEYTGPRARSNFYQEVSLTAAAGIRNRFRSRSPFIILAAVKAHIWIRISAVNLGWLQSQRVPPSR